MQVCKREFSHRYGVEYKFRHITQNCPSKIMMQQQPTANNNHQHTSPSNNYDRTQLLIRVERERDLGFRDSRPHFWLNESRRDKFSREWKKKWEREKQLPSSSPQLHLSTKSWSQKAVKLLASPFICWLLFPWHRAQIRREIMRGGGESHLAGIRDIWDREKWSRSEDKIDQTIM